MPPTNHRVIIKSSCQGASNQFRIEWTYGHDPYSTTRITKKARRLTPRPCLHARDPLPGGAVRCVKARSALSDRLMRRRRRLSPAHGIIAALRYLARDRSQVWTWLSATGRNLNSPQLTGEEKTRVEFLGSLMMHLENYAFEFEKALHLFDFSLAINTNRMRDPEQEVVHGRDALSWLYIAAKAAAMDIYHFGCALQAVGQQMIHCPSLLPHYDASAMRRARRLFNQYFPAVIPGPTRNQSRRRNAREPRAVSAPFRGSDDRRGNIRHHFSHAQSHPNTDARRQTVFTGRLGINACPPIRDYRRCLRRLSAYRSRDAKLREIGCGTRKRSNRP